LGFKKGEERIKERYVVHIGFSLLLFVVIVIFKSLHNDSLINQLFTAAGYTYGPLLGMFALGLFSKVKVKDKIVPFLAIASAVGTYFINLVLVEQFDFKLGFLVLLLNGGITMLLLVLTAKRVDS
jgi:sugar phosphate permease